VTEACGVATSLVPERQPQRPTGKITMPAVNAHNPSRMAFFPARHPNRPHTPRVIADMIVAWINALG
jgi:hypothetical protein